MTTAQMAEESRKATAEGMREMAKALNSSAPRAKKRRVASLSPSESSESSSDSSYSSSTSSSGSEHYRAKRLEERIHYMKLDYSNLLVQKQDLETELESLKKRFDPYTRINEEMAQLDSSLERSKKGYENLNLHLLEKKYNNFVEEFVEHYLLAMNAVSLVEQESVKVALQESLRMRQSQFDDAQSIISNKIKNKKIIELMYGITGVILLLKILAVVVYGTVLLVKLSE